jgi:formylglycine-generating enzyme required for sulfatase activity
MYFKNNCLVLVAVCLIFGTIFCGTNVALATPAAAAPGDMVLVQGGTFQMGDTFGDSGCKDDKPVHQVTVRSFYIGKYDVTFGEYGAFCQATGRHTPGHSGGDWGLRPVFNVSWYDALAYCNWRSQQEGLTLCYVINGDKTTCDFAANGYRLPTEAEWEYAAKGGNQSKGYKYSGSNYPNDVAWYSGNSGQGFIDQNGLDGCQVHLVGRLQPNELGLYDMSGNVGQWCWDCYDKNYYQTSTTDNPTGQVGGSERVIRGGDDDSNAWIVRTTTRGFGSPSLRFAIGFRLVRLAQ